MSEGSDEVRKLMGEMVEMVPRGVVISEYSLEKVWAGGSLRFSESGALRMASTLGCIHGLKLAERRGTPIEQLARAAGEAPIPVGDHLALDLGRALYRLHTYGGKTVEYPEGHTKEGLKYRETRIVLGDDRTFGGFTVTGYRAVTQERWKHTYDQVSGENPDWVSRDVVGKVEERLRTNRKLTQTLWARPDWAIKGKRKAEEAGRDVSHFGPDRFIVRWAYRWSGVLMLHDFHPFTGTEKSSEVMPYWSLHT